jgi:hypothetical protein
VAKGKNKFFRASALNIIKKKKGKASTPYINSVKENILYVKELRACLNEF